MVGRASAEQLARAKRLLAHEGAGAGASAAESAAAAGRIYEKLHAHLAPLVGAAGVQALLERSVKLIQSEFSFLGRVWNLLYAHHDVHRRATHDAGAARCVADYRRGGTHGEEQVSDRVAIRKLPSGVPGLDDVLGGGIPEFSSI